MDGKKKPAKKRVNGKAKKPATAPYTYVVHPKTPYIKAIDPVTLEVTTYVHVVPSLEPVGTQDIPDGPRFIDLRGQGETRELSTSETLDVFVEGARAMLARRPKDKTEESYLEWAKRWAECVIVQKDEAVPFLNCEETRQALAVGIHLTLTYCAMGGFMMQHKIDELEKRRIGSKRGGHRTRTKSMAGHEELKRVILEEWNKPERPKSMKVFVGEVKKALPTKETRSGKKPMYGKSIISACMAELGLDVKA